MKPMGGTELMEARIKSLLSKETMKGVRIVHGNPNVPLKATDVNIFVAHDLPTDKGIDSYFRNNPKSQYQAIVTVSDWQKGLFVSAGYPPENVFVIRNFIEPIPFKSRKVDPSETIRFIYTPTPHRGLEELFVAFEYLSKDHDIHLDVYSSFKLYGQAELDANFQELFDHIKKHPKITYHGSVSNAEIRKALVQSHAFAYPCKWHETSCLCLIEAMSADIECIHSSYAAMAETSGGMTAQFDWVSNPYLLANRMVTAMETFIHAFREGKIGYEQASYTKARADILFSPEKAKYDWERLIEKLKKARHNG